MSAIDTISSVGAASRAGVQKNPRERKLLARIAALFSGMERLLEKRRSRHMLLDLTDSQLKDIGITRADAYREGIRSIFD
ncbi:DUF1127 domain-containing protein [Mesorhizobium sp. ZC-5]|uniref:DUF1127 domain-containing protein n=1 Tax=Mesorhizobium sp. ZC-5 TaxID=2986066 RepID=UPI0021E8C307|nr:DUF1127 domain-containing protein [Mesorhizobium sp. ZC-5]MCV3241487.1 DUF1127 domain-containing protein [Mesorhizobium sp. ZC-5]